MTRKPPGNLGKFPPAPTGLTAAQRRYWTATVRSFPADWFRASDLPLVVELVRAHAMADDLEKRIAKTSDLADLKTLMQLRDGEVRRAAALATKLRLPPQSRSDRHLAGAAARHIRGTARPWDDTDDGEEHFFRDGL